MRTRKKNKGETPALEMTPMIDVVFQLLIFFIVAIKQEDILSRLNASRPAPDSAPTDVEPKTIEIEISKVAIITNKRTVAVVLRGDNPDYSGLDTWLGRQARLSKKSTVTIRCTQDSRHGALVQVLDLCKKNGLDNLMIFSL